MLELSQNLGASARKSFQNEDDSKHTATVTQSQDLTLLPELKREVYLSFPQNRKELGVHQYPTYVSNLVMYYKKRLSAINLFRQDKNK